MRKIDDKQKAATSFKVDLDTRRVGSAAFLKKLMLDAIEVDDMCFTTQNNVYPSCNSEGYGKYVSYRQEHIFNTSEHP